MFTKSSTSPRRSSVTGNSMTNIISPAKYAKRKIEVLRSRTTKNNTTIYSQLDDNDGSSHGLRFDLLSTPLVSGSHEQDCGDSVTSRHSLEDNNDNNDNIVVVTNCPNNNAVTTMNQITPSSTPKSPPRRKLKSKASHTSPDDSVSPRSKQQSSPKLVSLEKVSLKAPQLRQKSCDLSLYDNNNTDVDVDFIMDELSQSVSNLPGLLHASHSELSRETDETCGESVSSTSSSQRNLGRSLDHKHRALRRIRTSAHTPTTPSVPRSKSAEELGAAETTTAGSPPRRLRRLSALSTSATNVTTESPSDSDKKKKKSLADIVVAPVTLDTVWVKSNQNDSSCRHIELNIFQIMEDQECCLETAAATATVSPHSPAPLRTHVETKSPRRRSMATITSGR